MSNDTAQNEQKALSEAMKSLEGAPPFLLMEVMVTSVTGRKGSDFMHDVAGLTAAMKCAIDALLEGRDPATVSVQTQIEGKGEPVTVTMEELFEMADEIYGPTHKTTINTLIHAEPATA